MAKDKRTKSTSAKSAGPASPAKSTGASPKDATRAAGRSAKPTNDAVPYQDRILEEGEILTTNQGMVISDNHNSLKAGIRGPTLLEDFVLREKIMSFDHERIPERVVHAR